MPGRRWLDEDFTRDGLGAALATASPIVHIATHFSVGADERSSRMLLGKGGTLSVEDIRAGMATGELNFSKVQLLVLSACETALGDGRELESLAATMQNNGVRSVVATLWPVVDGTTTKFMIRFYAYLNLGLSRSEALRQTQMDFIHNRSEDKVAIRSSGTNSASVSTDSSPILEYIGLSHPRYWAPYVLMGQWN